MDKGLVDADVFKIIPAAEQTNMEVHANRKS
jgi:hypothetical protein